MLERATQACEEVFVEEYTTTTYHVFSVYYKRQNWKFLQPLGGGEAAHWIKPQPGQLDGPVTKNEESWLNGIRRHSQDYPKVIRSCRKDQRGEELISQMADAHRTGQSNLLALRLEQLQKHLVSTRHAIEWSTALTWATIPRFSPLAFKGSKWLIDSFLAERTIQLIFGERGAFKSTLLAFAGKAVAAGEEFLGMKTRQRRVLYLDYENPANVIKARNDDLQLGLPQNPNFAIWDRFGKHSLPKPGDSSLETFVKNCVEETSYGPWIILDSWSSLLKSGEGGEITAQTAPIYIHLRRLADLGATLTMVDHTLKYDRRTVYGSQDKEAKVDSIHYLLLYENELRPQNSIVRVESWLKRQAPKGEGAFSFEVQSEQDKKGEWHIMGLVPAEDPELKKERHNIELLQELIRNNPHASQSELTDLASSRRLARDRAAELLRSGTGKYWDRTKSRHNKLVYSVR
jgi:hypothetical protein